MISAHKDADEKKHEMMVKKKNTILIISQGVGAIPIVPQLCHALRDQHRVIVAGPDGRTAAGRVGAQYGFDLFSTSGLAQVLRRIRSPRPRREEMEASLQQGGVSAGNANWFWYLMRFIFRSIPALFRLLLIRPPDFLICVDALYLPVTRIAAAVWRRPYAYAMIEIYSEQDSSAGGGKKKLMAWVESFGVTKAAGLMVPDKTWARILKMRYKLAGLPVFVIRTCPVVPNNIPETFGVDGSKPLQVYYHGMFSPDRGLECTIQAMKYTQNATLSLRGFGVIEDKLRQMVADEKLGGKVFFLAPVEREELTKSAVGHDVGVVAFEGTLANGRFGVGFKTYEYLAAGLALLTPPSRVLKALVSETQTGLVYGFGDARSLADCINRFEMDRSLLAQCTNSARYWARNRFNEEVQSEFIRSAVTTMIC